MAASPTAKNTRGGSPQLRGHCLYELPRRDVLLALHRRGVACAVDESSVISLTPSLSISIDTPTKSRGGHSRMAVTSGVGVAVLQRQRQVLGHRSGLAVGETRHSADAPSPSLLIHLLNVEGGAAE